MKKTKNTADGTLKWEDAREGDVVYVNNERFEVRRWAPSTGLYVEGSLDGQVMKVPLCHVRAMGAHLERDVEEEPQHRLLPTEEHAIVICGGDAYQRTYWGEWHLFDDEDITTNEELQRFANARGFTRLVPETEVEEARAEGWKQGIQDVDSLLGHKSAPSAFKYGLGCALRREFPEAFEQDGGEQ